MKQRQFELRHKQEWEQFEALVSQLERSSAASGHDSAGFPEAYRKLCHQYALACERGYGMTLQQQLNELVIRGHRQLYRFRRPFWGTLVRLLRTDFPRSVRQLWAWHLASLLAFAGPLALVWLLVAMHPDLVYSVLDSDTVAQMEVLYEPGAAFREQRDAADDVQMFGFYIANNIGIAFRTFAGGLFLGVGALFFMLFNGSFFGAIAAHLVNVGSSEPFFTFVIAHGAPELTAIVLAGGAGLRLGWSLLSPGQLSRLQALKAGAAQAMPVVYGCFFLLLAAAFIEAFWSPRLLAPGIKYAVGAGCWILVFAYLGLAGRR